MQRAGAESRLDRPQLLTLWGARVIDGRGNVLERASVVISGDRITQAAPLTSDQPPAGVIDLRGRTLLPGLIDAHVHLSSDVDRSPGFGPPPALKGEPPRARELGYFVLASAARAFIEAGI